MLRVFEDGRRNPNGPSSAHYGQLCKALLDLQEASDKIFDTIIDRVGAEHQRLKGLSSRIKIAKAKIDALSGTKRAITIKSSSRYPLMSSDVEDFRPLFGGKFGGVRTDFPIATLSLNSGLSRESGEDGTLELFRFFSETSHEYFANNKTKKVGLGNMPSETNSVSDILLFNSTELPYHRYKMMDNLVVRESSTEETLELKLTTLPPPPPSLLQGSKSSSARSEDFGFKPTLRQLPSFSLPSSLPDLPMIADISWTGSKSEDSQKSSTITSAVGVIALNDATPLKSDSGLLQDFHEDSSISSVSECNSSQKSFPFKEEIPSRFSTQTLTNDKSMNALVHNANLKEISSPSPPPPSPPPPPPPPPTHTSPLTSSLDSSVSIGKKKHISEPTSSRTQADGAPRGSSLPQIDSQRASLMATIRNPGITLKKTGLLDSNSKTGNSVMDSIKTGNSSNQPENTAIHPKPKSVNLLAEMAASLKMRRLSMQGAAHDKDQIAASDVTSPSASSTKFTLPISNIQAYISQIEEVSEEEDWED